MAATIICRGRSSFIWTKIRMLFPTSVKAPWRTCGKRTHRVCLYNTLDQQTAVTPLKDIVGYFARRELTFDYRNQVAITNALNTQGPPAVWKRFQLTELVRRADDTNWWRVPMEIAPMQGAYAT